MTGKTTSGGGAANHAGTNYQDYVAAWIAVQILAEQDVTPPWELPVTDTLEALHAEAPHPIDDLTVHTSSGGRGFAQAKHTVNLEATPSSALGSTFAQFVAEYRAAAIPFDSQRDRFVLVTSPLSSTPIKVHLPAFLRRMRTSSHPDLEWTSGSQHEVDAARVLRDHLQREWQSATGTLPTANDLTALTRLSYIHILDVDPGGQAFIEAKNTLRQRILKHPTDGDTAWNTLITTTSAYAANHQRADRRALQHALIDVGLDLQAQRSHREDIERLKTYASTTLATLVDFSQINIGTQSITIQRPAATVARAAANQGHLLVLGTPGAGKSGALYDVAHTLHAQGSDVVLLAVDHLEAGSVGALRNELGLTHELTDVLTAWPGTAPAYLMIDALDAARTVGAAHTLHGIMGQVIAYNTRWRVVASVRKFDLRYNTPLRRLFLGTPPSTYSDAEFSTIRHVNIPVLSNAELDELAHQAPALKTLITNAPPPLNELLHVPFNLRLLAELLTTGVTAAQLQPLETQIELLDRYWVARILRYDGQGDAREEILRRITDAMVQQRVLSVPRTTATANEPAASAILHDLLSAHILAEWTTPTGAARREILTFPHHLLFDYAVARLSMSPDHATLVATLTSQPDLLLAIRPSIELHYQRLWYNDPASFWNLVFQAIRGSMPEIGKLIGPSIAALHANSIVQYQPLLAAINHTTTSTHDEGMAALRHILNTFLANAQPLTLRATPWCDLINASTSTMTLESAGTIRPSVWYLSEHAETLTPSQLSRLGAVARRLLAYALSIAPEDRGLPTAAITAVNKTATTDVPASTALLRACITQASLSSIGYRTLRHVAGGIVPLSSLDPVYVHDIYIAALRHQDKSEETTSMNDSQIMGFTSRRRQDYTGGLYQLGEDYPAFLTQAPGSAVATLLDALDLFAHEHHHTNCSQLPVDINGTQAFLVPDRSHSWDSMSIYEHDLPMTMLGHLQSRIQALADENNPQGVQKVLGALTVQPLAGVVWRRLLLGGTHSPTTLGRQIRSLAWDATILTSPDTTRTAGTFIRAVHPLLSEEDRARIEQAIMALPTSNTRQASNRDRLIGCLETASIVSQNALDHRAALTQHGGPPTNEEDTGGFWNLVDSSPAPADAVQAFITPVTAFINQHLNGLPDDAAIISVLPALRTLSDAIAAPAEPLTPNREAEATLELLRAATRIARAGGLTPNQCTRLLSIFLPATTNPDPPEEEEDTKNLPLTSWCQSPRTLAAEGVILIARYAAGCTAAAQTAIRALSTDPVRAVRGQISHHLGCAYRTAPDLCWDLLDHYAAHEQNASILVDALQLLRHVDVGQAAKAAALAAQIFTRTPSSTERNEVRDACIHVFCEFDFYTDPTCKAMLEQLIADPTTHSTDVQRMILDLAVDLTAAVVARRNRAFAYYTRILTAVVSAMRGIDTANPSTTPWSPVVQSQYGQLLRCADEIAQRVYFASGAFKHANQDSTFLAPDVFYAQAKPLFTQLAEIGHPHTAHQVLEALEYFIPTDPAGVLILVGNVVSTGSKYGYQYEQLAETLMVRTVEKYLAEYREVLRECPECHTALMDILDIFVRVGWPGAHQLTYRLSDIYR